MSVAGLSKSLVQAAIAAEEKDEQALFKDPDSGITVRGPLQGSICVVVFSGVNHADDMKTAARKLHLVYGDASYMVFSKMTGIGENKSALLVARSGKNK